MRSIVGRFLLPAFVIAAPWLQVSPSVWRVARADMVSDFETGADLQRWSVIGTLQGQLLPLPAVPDAAAAGSPPAGNGVRLTTPGASGFFIKSGQLPAGVARFDTLRFWVHRQPAAGDAAKPSTIEVRFYESDGKAWFWRRMVLDHEGWKQVEVPLAWTRWSDTRVPRWERVDRFGIVFHDAADVIVDSFDFADDPPPNGPDGQPVIDANDIARVAFGAKPREGGEPRVAARDGLAVVTDAPDLDADRLLDHLQKVAEKAADMMPFARKRSRPVILVVFADEEAYRQFWPAFAARFDAPAALPKSDGFTALGIAASSWHPRFGTFRPVYTHEFVHSLLTSTLLLDNKSEWFQEGLATHFQLQFHPQAGADAQILRAIGEADDRILETVCTGSSLPLEGYWVAGTLCRMLLEDPDLAPKMPAVVAAMQDSGSTALEPLLPLLGVSWAELDAKWRAFCRTTYGDK
jgi:hypothetical protein